MSRIQIYFLRMMVYIYLVLLHQDIWHKLMIIWRAMMFILKCYLGILLL